MNSSAAATGTKRSERRLRITRANVLIVAERMPAPDEVGKDPNPDCPR
jgi:hypothetical protein